MTEERRQLIKRLEECKYKHKEFYETHPDFLEELNSKIYALKNGNEDVAMMRGEYNGRRRYVLKRFQDMGLPCFEPFGAFYAFPCIREFGMTSDEFATELLQSKKVAVVPGTAFGACGEGFLRISYAYSLDDLRTALDRVEEFVTELRENNG